MSTIYKFNIPFFQFSIFLGKSKSVGVGGEWFLNIYILHHTLYVHCTCSRRRKIIGVFIKIDPASSVVKKKVKAKSAIEVDLFEAITRKVEGVSEKDAS